MIESCAGRYFYIGFIGFILKGLLAYRNPFSPNDYKNNNNTQIFSIAKKMDNLYCVISGKYRKCEKPKISLWYHFSLLVQEWIWKKN